MSAPNSVVVKGRMAPGCGHFEAAPTRLERAIRGLSLLRPEFSASHVFTKAQLAVLSIASVTGAALFAAWPHFCADIAVLVMSLSFVASMIARMALVLAGRQQAPAAVIANDLEYPVYTVLVPLYHEADMVPALVMVLGALDYPADKLDIHLVLEESDGETIAAARQFDMPLVIVPEALPRTKPKAVNYAAEIAQGEFLVVYDAEDRPEPDQLKKAVRAFRACPQVSCFQARLVIDRGRSWIQQMFALDYGVWFNVLLPGLARLRAPLPLGGTSNHFRRIALFDAGLWDPFNVTEDADLGLRLARLGHGVGVLDSETFEAPPARLAIWLRQRTRWIKGYMQTLLVHTRNPLALWHQTGLPGLFCIAMILGGSISSALINPLLWCIFFYTMLVAPQGESVLRELALACGVMLLVTNALLAALGSAGRKDAVPLAATLFYPLYWLMISAAAYRALYQLLRDPFLWEKTPHEPPA